jgi:hypothetical protein
MGKVMLWKKGSSDNSDNITLYENVIPDSIAVKDDLVIFKVKAGNKILVIHAYGFDWISEWEKEDK